MSIADLLFQRNKEKAEANLKKGQEFLDQNKQREGVKSLESGLQYEVLTHTEGDHPTASSKVTCHYEGRLIDGQIFDSSIKRGQPATFPLDRVIAGWTEGLQLMAPGSKFRFFIPPHLAYGERQTGSILPNSTLIFDVELISFS